MTSSVYEAGDIPPIELRHRLRIAREWANLDQSQLAALMDVTRSTVSNAENCRTTPHRATVNAWALACGVPVSWLRTGEQPPAKLGTEDYHSKAVHRRCPPVIKILFMHAPISDGAA